MRAFVVTVILLSGCSRGFSAPGDSVLLPIADRQWEPGAPPEGWCGETTIQLATGWYGAYVSQAKANALGQPKTPDLWEHDIPTALRALQLRFERGPKSREALLSFVVEQLRAGRPVILGTKLVPTDHPEWHVDHIVLAVGFTPKGLIIDTNFDEGQITVAWSGLLSAEGDQTYSLVNASGEVFGFAVSGFYEASPLPVRVTVVEQNGDQATIDVTVPELREGLNYELLRNGESLEQFTAKKSERKLRTVVPVNEVTHFTARFATTPR
ncbi:MAG: hypothetical protein ACO1OB_28750 [Archangium sp.]